MPHLTNHRSLLLLLVAVIAGCAAYSVGIREGFQSMERGNYTQAIKTFEQQLAPDGQDRLLYFMELGLLHYLAGDYETAIADLNQAETIGDDLYTQRLGDLLVTAMTNPRSGPYAGADYELAYLHYYKMLAFLRLVGEQPQRRAEWLDGARVEARKIDIRLTSLVVEKGDYGTAKEEKASFFSKVVDVFGQILGESHIGADREYRDDAFLRYMTGLVYELRGEYGEARVSYQQAAEGYEAGFAKQYFLSPEMVEQAWFDTLRMMKRVGGFETELARLSKEKLSEGGRKRLAERTPAQGEVVVLQNVGRTMERKELNLLLYMEPTSNDLIIRPLLGGPEREQQAEAGWFFAIYGGGSFLENVYNFRQANIFGVMDGLFSKRLPTSVVGGLVRSLGLPELMGQGGLRVTVPYYQPPRVEFGASRVYVGDDKGSLMLTATSIADIALQDQLVEAGTDLREAVGRELVKAHFARQISDNAKGEAALVLGLVSRFATIATSAAETRNWLSLPFAVRLQRIPLAPGDYPVRLVTDGKPGGVYNSQNERVTVAQGQLALLPLRTFRCVEGNCRGEPPVPAAVESMPVSVIKQ